MAIITAQPPRKISGIRRNNVAIAIHRLKDGIPVINLLMAEIYRIGGGIGDLIFYDIANKPLLASDLSCLNADLSNALNLRQRALNLP